ncbi:MAG: 2,3-diaminopropionate biosynthesis protein SbnA [Verrucomicrobia bacterium]|nr:2,3-diaminopropionate biosynthesis protein SbnA [Verrucomicrobiota bacterium]
MIVNKVSDLTSEPLFFELKDMIPEVDVFLKIEGLNIAGSIKFTTAKEMIRAAKASKEFSPHTEFIESSSGNLGVALSILCKEQGIPFWCVIDPNITEKSQKLMEAYGAKLIRVTTPDENGGFLGTRIREIENRLKSNPNFIWVNQYANEANPNAHYMKTAPEIDSEFDRIDYLVIGAGTTGTLMGCARYFREHHPNTKIIGVDAIGSVTFGGLPKKRFVPGIGTSRKPPIANESLIDKIVFVDEKDGISMCHYLLDHYGLLLGGSTGSVIHAVKQLKEEIPPGSVVVAISPDFGEKYLDTVFNQNWVLEKYYESLSPQS